MVTEMKVDGWELWKDRINHHGQFPVSHWPVRCKDHCPAPGTTDGLDVKKGPGCKLLQMLVVFLVIVKRVD